MSKKHKHQMFLIADHFMLPHNNSSCAFMIYIYIYCLVSDGEISIFLYHYQVKIPTKKLSAFLLYQNWRKKEEHLSFEVNIGLYPMIYEYFPECESFVRVFSLDISEINLFDTADRYRTCSPKRPKNEAYSIVEVHW